MSHQDWGDSATPLVIDTSVVINLVASGHGNKIARLLKRQVLVPEIVSGELQLGAEVGCKDASVLSEWIAQGTIQKAALSEAALDHFERLISGASSASLDDGEAATIAHAQDIGAIAVIDERKATRICKELFPSVVCISTVDVFFHPNIIQQLGQELMVEALFNALTEARMRVLPHHQQRVADLLGPERVVVCSSLPVKLRNST